MEAEADAEGLELAAPLEVSLEPDEALGEAVLELELLQATREKAKTSASKIAVTFFTICVPFQFIC